MTITKLAQTISNQQLAILITRAKNGKLITLPNVTISQNKLDCTTSKGATLTYFLAHLDKPFSAKSEAIRLERIAFILSTLAQKGVDLAKELERTESTNDNSSVDQTPQKPSKKQPKRRPKKMTINTTQHQNNSDTDIPVMATKQEPAPTQTEYPTPQKEPVKPVPSIPPIYTDLQGLAHLQDRVIDLQSKLLESEKDKARLEEMNKLLEDENLQLQSQIILMKEQSEKKFVLGYPIGKVTNINKHRITKDGTPYKHSSYIAYIPDKETGKRKQVPIGSTYDLATFERILIEKGYGTPKPTPLPTNSTCSDSQTSIPHDNTDNQQEPKLIGNDPTIPTEATENTLN